MEVLLLHKFYGQSGEDKLLQWFKSWKDMQWLSKYYGMVMEWLFDPVAVVSCGGLRFDSL